MQWLTSKILKSSLRKADRYFFRGLEAYWEEKLADWLASIIVSLFFFLNFNNTPAI